MPPLREESEHDVNRDTPNRELPGYENFPLPRGESSWREFSNAIAEHVAYDLSHEIVQGRYRLALVRREDVERTVREIVHGTLEVNMLSLPAEALNDLLMRTANHSVDILEVHHLLAENEPE